MDDEHGYLDLSATAAILRALWCRSRHSPGIGDAPHVCGRHPLSLTRNLVVCGQSADRRATKALLNLTKEGLRLITLRAHQHLARRAARPSNPSLHGMRMRRSPCARLKPRTLGLIPADDEFVPHPRRATTGAKRAVPPRVACCKAEGGRRKAEGGRRKAHTERMRGLPGSDAREVRKPNSGASGACQALRPTRRSNSHRG